MYRKWSKTALICLLTLLAALTIPMLAAITLAEGETESIEWRSNTQDDSVDFAGGIQIGSGDWKSETYIEGEDSEGSGSETQDDTNSTTTFAILAGIAGVLGIC